MQKMHYDQLTAFHVQAGTEYLSLTFSTGSDLSHGFAALTAAAARGHPGTLLAHTQDIYQPAFLRLIL